jgi:MFS family permease
LSPVAGVILLLAVLSGSCFFWIERKAAQPMLNLGLFRNLTFSLASVSALLNFMSQYVMVFLTPFYLQRVLRCAPNDLGLIMTSFPLAVMAVAPFSGSLSDRVGTSALASIGAAICAVALLLMSFMPSDPAPADIIWRLALFGLGTGIFQSPNNSAVMGNAPRPHLGVASGILATMRNVGMVLGIAAGGAVLYASAPGGVLQKGSLEQWDAAAFQLGLNRALALGALLTAAASLMSLLRSDGFKKKRSTVQ